MYNLAWSWTMPGIQVFFFLFSFFFQVWGDYLYHFVSERSLKIEHWTRDLITTQTWKVYQPKNILFLPHSNFQARFFWASMHNFSFLRYCEVLSVPKLFNQQMTIHVHVGRHLVGMNGWASKETILPHQCNVNENINRDFRRKIC